VLKHGSFYTDFLLMYRDACAMYPVLFIDKLAVTLGNYSRLNTIDMLDLPS